MAFESLPRVFKISDIAERWECSEHHVRKVIESGELRAFRIGKLWRVRLDAIDEYEARAAVEPKPPRPSPKPSEPPMHLDYTPKALLRAKLARLREGMPSRGPGRPKKGE